MRSGYTDCACTECFEVAVSNDVTKPDYCSECVKAGCEDSQHGCQVPPEEEE